MNNTNLIKEGGVDVYDDKDGTLSIYQGDDLVVLSKKSATELIKVLQEWVDEKH